MSMSTNKHNNQIASLIFYSGLFCFLLLMSSCARKINFTTSAVVPAAEGSVKVKKDDK